MSSKNLRITNDHLGEHTYDEDEAMHVYRSALTGGRFKVRAGDPQPKSCESGGDVEKLRTEHALVNFEPSDRFLRNVESGDAEAVEAASSPALAPYVRRAMSERQADRDARAAAKAAAARPAPAPSPAPAATAPASAPQN